MENTKRRCRRRSPLLWAIPLIIVLVAITCGLAAANRSYMILGGEFIPRDPELTDLRTYNITPEEFENIRGQYPDRQYCWSVPLSSGRFDSGAESITVGSFTEGDLNLLSYFTNLHSIDALGAEISPELYLALKEAWPEMDVRWSVPIGTGRYDSQSESVTLVSDFSEEELGRFDWLESLRTVDARACGCYEQILALREQRPEVDVLWQISLDGTVYDQDTTQISFSGKDLTVESFRQLLSRFPALERVDMTDCPFTAREQASLQEEYPDVIFGWEIEILGMRCTTAEESVTLAGRTDLGEAEYHELLDAAPMLRGWKNLDLMNCSFTREQIISLCDALPETHVLWSFDWCGVPVTTADEEVDLSNIPMSDTQAVEEMLPYMYNLKKVDMCNCGLSYETMDALTDRHPETRFIFVIDFSRYHVRTDTLGFIASIEYYGIVSDEDMLKISKHCKDMISIDVGHREPAHYDFLANMPQLKYLVLADGSATDISSFSHLKDLVWLEMTKCNAQDPTPLLECTALESLDVAFTAFPDRQKNFEVFSQMTWLQRLWISPAQFTETQLEQLREALPDTEIYICTYIGDRCGGTWRENERYFEMRDALQMWYMGTYGGIINRKLVDGEWVDAPYTGPYSGISHDKG